MVGLSDFSQLVRIAEPEKLFWFFRDRSYKAKSLLMVLSSQDGVHLAYIEFHSFCSF